MPIWLASALRLMTGRTAVAGGTGLALGGTVGDFFGGGDDRPRRRRRRRALTASDRADIAFIQGILGAPAAKSFAVTLVAGLTR